MNIIGFDLNVGTIYQKHLFTPLFEENSLPEKYNGISSQELLDIFIETNEIRWDYLSEMLRRVALGEAIYSRLSPNDQQGISSLPHLAGILIGERIIVRGRMRPHHEIENELEQWSRKHQCWVCESELRAISDEGKLFSHGTESQVYVDKCRMNVWKIMHPREGYDTVTIGDMLDGIAIFNSIFKKTHYDVLGYGRDDAGNMCAICKQALIKGRTVTRIGIDEHGGDEKWIEQAYSSIMENRGFVRDQYSWKKDQYSVTDITGNNVAVTSDGHTMVIDADANYIDSAFFDDTILQDI